MPVEFDKCRYCGESVEWGSWPSGKKMPLDAYPDPKGDLALAAGKISKYGAKDEKLKRERRRSHFDTCTELAT